MRDPSVFMRSNWINLMLEPWRCSRSEPAQKRFSRPIRQSLSDCLSLLLKCRLFRVGVARADSADFRYSGKSRSLLNPCSRVVHTVAG
jgi:hypothetical protein